MKFRVFGLLFFLLATSSCYKELAKIDLLKKPAILTHYDVNTDFSQFSTFAIVDSISVVSDNLALADRIATPNALTVLNHVKTEMSNRGFTQTNVVNADLGINVSVLHDLNLESGTVIMPGYWWGYDGYWDDSFWGYTGAPFYYGYNYNHIYESGSLLIEIYDLKNAGTTNKLKVIWNGEIGDLYQTDINLSEALESITQAFTQSPYLQR